MDKQTIVGRLDLKAYYFSIYPGLKINGEWGQAKCGFNGHQDNKPSLFVNLTSGIWHCKGCGAKGSVFDHFMKVKGVDYKTAFNALATEAGLTTETQKKAVKTYDYVDESGKLLFQTVRYEPKDFKQRRPVGNGSWIYNLQGVRLVLFNLPEVIKAKSVIVCEGEKDCLNLKAIGLTATCNPMGAGNGKWKPEYNQYFKGKKVVVIPDADKPGRDHALQIAKNLKGIAESVKVAELPGLKEKQDVSDWLLAGGTKEGLIELIKAAPEWEPTKEEYPGLIRLDTVTAEKVEWLWYPYIPLGKITLVDGDPGNGKSLFADDLISRVTSGMTMPDGNKAIHGGAVIMALEDGLADTIVPRLEAAGGDKSKVVALQGVPDVSGNLRFPTVQDVEHISKACKEVKAKLVVIDPLMGYLGDANSWKDQEIRKALAPLIRMAEEERVAVLVIRHLNKGSSANSLYRGGGTIGIIGLARVGLLIAKDPEDENRRILAGIKSNLAPLPISLAYSIENCDGIPKIVWEGACSHTADVLLATPTAPEEKSAVDEAKDFLRDVLQHGAANAKEIMKEARNAGISEVTLKRAKKYLRIISQKSDFKGVWLWRLPDEEYQDMSKGIIKNHDTLGAKLTPFDKEDRCLSCMLTPAQRKLCEVKKPCPKDSGDLQ